MISGNETHQRENKPNQQKEELPSGKKGGRNGLQEFSPPKKPGSRERVGWWSQTAKGDGGVEGC